MRPKQLSFLPRVSLEHGGSVRTGKRKIARPFDPKRPLHLVLRSSKAQGDSSMLHPRYKSLVERFSEMIAEKHQVKLYRFVNVGNHLHLLVQARSRKAFQSFLREMAGAIAMIITGGKKSNPIGRFWDQTAYSRIISWGRELKSIEQYFIKNLFEAAGLLTRKAKAMGLRPIPILGWATGPS